MKAKYIRTLMAASYLLIVSRHACLSAKARCSRDEAGGQSTVEDDRAEALAKRGFWQIVYIKPVEKGRFQSLGFNQTCY